jgi:hypothetical protein
MSGADDDELLEAEIQVIEKLADEALAIYKGRLPADEYDLIRETIIEVLATHPNGRAMIERLLPRAPVEVSGEIGEPGDASESDRGGQARGGSGVA